MEWGRKRKKYKKESRNERHEFWDWKSIHMPRTMIEKNSHQRALSNFITIGIEVPKSSREKNKSRSCQIRKQTSQCQHWSLVYDGAVLTNFWENDFNLDFYTKSNYQLNVMRAR